MSKKEDVLNGIKDLISGVVDNTKVFRNLAIPETIPDNGLIIIRDGDPGEPDIPLGGFTNAYYQHDAEIEILVGNATTTERDEVYNTLVEKIGEALDSNRTLSGLIFGMTFGQPSPSTEYIEGAPDLKIGILTVTLDYETTTALT